MNSDTIDSLKEVDTEYLLQNPEAFNSFIYTTLDEAILELDRRWKDKTIPDYVPIPSSIAKGGKAVLFRQLITSNYEARRFVNIVDATNLEPLFWEYHTDKFTSNNEWKHSLGKLFFYEGIGKLGGRKINTLNIIDFNTYNGKKILEVKTLWNESLIDFHHSLYESCFKSLQGQVYDASAWFKENGGTANKYYESFISLFIKHGILFENFMLNEKEIGFTSEIFLPAFIEVYKKTGLKPLIVSLEPTDIEGDHFWMCHPQKDKAFVEEKFSTLDL
jgi:hypothetical protein